MVNGRSSFVVHNCALIDQENGKDTSLSNEELLFRGQKLVSAVEARDGWRTISSPSAPSLNLGKVLVLKKAPPSSSSFRHDLRERASVKPLRARGVVSDATDVLDVSQLKKFEGTDFSHLLDRQGPWTRSSSSAASVKIQTEKGKGKRPYEALSEPDDIGEQKKKMRRPVGNTTIPLYDLIPHPHHHSYSPAPLDQHPNSDITKRFSPFSKAPFVPIAPYTASSTETYFKDPYARSAWVIPVNGKLPWKEASPANLVDNSLISTAQSQPVSSGHSFVTWTPLVIKKFWSDVLEMRRRGVLGAISLSFHVATKTSEKDVTRPTDTAGRLAETTTELPRDLDSPTSLEQCTYLKVYHDVRYAMYVRSVFDAWRTEVEMTVSSVASRVTTSPRRTRPASGGASLPPKKIRIRPLQGARLILLNEAGQPVGLC